MALHRFTLHSTDGIEVELVDHGAAIEVVRSPDRNGDVCDITLRLDSDDDRRDRNPHLGITVGRFANRIGGARFTLDDTEHTLDANEGANILHGGTAGFGTVAWHGDQLDEQTVRFSRHSPAGDMGFPGALDATVTYRLDAATISIDFEATTDAATVCSMTNHAYWNLGGPTEATIDAHVVTIDASRVVPVDDDLIPDGPPVDADGPFDLRSGASLGARIGFPLPHGYDHCFMIDGDGFRRHARVDHPASGRRLDVWSDHPAAQFYTGAFLDGPGGGGRHHGPFAALAVEPQHVPDAPNQAWAPSTVLRPGETYTHHLEFRLSVDAHPPTGDGS
ncbi:MAG: aldose epimerase family protein [Actinomycetota bacterium]